ncbi:MAG TPA: hypothetical protein VMU59_09040 [Caulobacteraceae bacterium]|nr:hypothetical protein [Caulobacteraceae bacterium]
MGKSRLILLISAALALPVFAHAETYRVIDRIKVPDGGFDYSTYDPATARVYMPRGDYTTVIDTKTGNVSQLQSAVGNHIALPIPQTPLLVVTQSAGTILLVDKDMDKVVASFMGEKNPNSAAYDPATKVAVVLNKDSGTATLIDPFARQSLGTIPISANTLEFPAADGTGRVFINIETSAEIAVLDVHARKIAKLYKLNGCVGPTGLAFDVKARLLISACANGVAKVVRADDGTEVASLPIGRGPDAVIFDPVRQVAFVPCGKDGVLDVISLADPRAIKVVQQVQTEPGSRTGAVDPSTGKVYLMSSKPDLAAPIPPNGRQPRLAGSWAVLVVAPS